MTLGRNPFELKKPPEEEPPEERRVPPVAVAERPPAEPEGLPPIPPEGVTYTVQDKKGKDLELKILEDFEYVGTERRLRSQDYVVYSGKTEIGRYSRETGEFVSKEPTWWEKTLGVGAKALEVAFAPFTITGMALREMTLAPELPEEGRLEARTQEIMEQFGYPQGTARGLALGEISTAEFRTLPWWQQLLWESPAWIGLAASGLSALKGWRAAAKLPTVAKVAVRVPLAPLAGYEWAVGKTVQIAYKTTMSTVLRRNLHSWAKSAGKTIPKSTEDAFVEQAVRQLSPKFMAKETVKTLFRSTKAGFTITETGAKAAETAAAQAVRTSPLLLGTGKIAVSSTAIKAVVIPPIKPPIVPPVKPPTIPAVPEVGREVFEAREEIAGLREYLVTEPAARLTRFVKRVGRMKGELPDITIQQYKDMTGKTTVRENILTPDKKHVRL